MRGVEMLLDFVPFAPFLDRRTAGPPGLSPLDPADWTLVLPDFAAQMAERERLISASPEVVLACLPEAAPAAAELLGALLAHLGGRADYAVSAEAVTRPDGVSVPLPARGGQIAHPTLAAGGTALAATDGGVSEGCGVEPQPADAAGVGALAAGDGGVPAGGGVEPHPTRAAGGGALADWAVPAGGGVEPHPAHRGGADADGLHAMAMAGRLTAEDWCLMLADPAGGEYRLGAAVLCFPSRWSLAEKLGHPLTVIHDPVPDYDDVLAARVNRVFAAIRPGRPVTRVNWLVHPTADPHLPKRVAEKLAPLAFAPGGPLFLRTERQTLLRLPRTGAVVFGIKTSITPLERLAPEVAAGLATALGRLEATSVAYRAGADLIGEAVARLSARAGGLAAG